MSCSSCLSGSTFAGGNAAASMPPAKISAVRLPRSRQIVTHRERQQDDENGLEYGDGQRCDGVERSEVEKGDLHRRVRAEHQDGEDRVVDAWGQNVLRHAGG